MCSPPERTHFAWLGPTMATGALVRACPKLQVELNTSVHNLLDTTLQMHSSLPELQAHFFAQSTKLLQAGRAWPCRGLVHGMLANSTRASGWARSRSRTLFCVGVQVLQPHIKHVWPVCSQVVLSCSARPRVTLTIAAPVAPLRRAALSPLRPTTPSRSQSARQARAPISG